jgi:DedD protein
MSWFNWRTSAQAASASTSPTATASLNNSATLAATQSTLQNEDRLRTVARRRLIGAAILVALTVLIFPWVFKQQPKPLNDDLIIEVPRKDAAKATSEPQIAAPAVAAKALTSAAGKAASAPDATAAASLPPIADTSPAASKASIGSTTVGSTTVGPTTVQAPQLTPPTSNPVPMEAAVVAAAAATAVAVAAKPAINAQLAKSNNKPDIKPAATATTATNKPAAAPEKPEPKNTATQAVTATGGRFVVQVAAFAEAGKARDVRIKLESQGYKTYSQAIDTPKGKVWRVRVGPFDNKAAAEKAKSQISGKGFQPALLEL